MKKISKIGIMSGRLSEKIDGKIQTFPTQTWKKEFQTASMIGFESIEWIFDIIPNNPIMNKNQIREIEFLTKEFGIEINSVCADYFMEKRLFNISKIDVEKNIGTLNQLIKNCSELEIKILEIPFVDISSLKTEKDRNEICKNLEKILPIAEKNGVELTLETDLPPKLFKKLIDLINHPNIKANYDTGNSASLGYNVEEEFDLLGPKISNIHIKDRKLHGKTVQLGKGDTDFEKFFSKLQKINYEGDLIIQGAREELRDSPVEICTKYLEFVKKYMDRKWE